MKKVFFIWLVVLAICAFFAIHFSFPTKVKANEKILFYKKQAIISLCNENADLAEKLNRQLDDGAMGIKVFFDKNGKVIEIVPTPKFFFLLKCLVERSKNVKDREINKELTRHNKLLRDALENGNYLHFVEK